MCGHCCPGAIGCWLLAPVLDGFLHDSTFLEGGEAQADTGGVRDCVVSCCSKLSALVGASEDVFRWCVGVPC